MNIISKMLNMAGWRSPHEEKKKTIEEEKEETKAEMEGLNIYDRGPMADVEKIYEKKNDTNN